MLAAPTQMQPDNGPAVPANPITAQDVIGFLSQTTAWYRHLSVEQQLAHEVIQETYFIRQLWCVSVKVVCVS